MIVKQNDLFPSVIETVKDGNGNPVDLTGAAVKFSMRPARNPGTPTLALVAANIFGLATNGQVQYQWSAGDTAVPGTYEAEFQILPAVGAAFRVPTDGYIVIVIEQLTG